LELGSEAASRSFAEIERFRILFKTICDRVEGLREGNPFPINSARSVWRVLAFRENGFLALDRYKAKLLVAQSVEMMEEEANISNFDRRYFQGAQLFFFLLRFRCQDSSFLDPQSPQDKDLFDRAKLCLERAKKYFRLGVRGAARARRAQDILNGIESYMYFKGKRVIIFDEFIGADTDDV
jgi:hypothetical protein